ncbi:MAG TPA: DoxX family protein, partial [Casimicrobiaceae bacterium]|nr:DoxX family protein [Casimicrobiaceae bacterium]
MTNSRALQQWAPRTLSVLRIVTAFLFMMHGSAKLLHVPHQAQFDNLQLMSLIGVQGVLELVGGLLLLIGLFSRPVAFLLCGDMAVAYFMQHFPKNWLPLLN